MGHSPSLDFSLLSASLIFFTEISGPAPLYAGVISPTQWKTPEVGTAILIGRNSFNSPREVPFGGLAGDTSSRTLRYSGQLTLHQKLPPSWVGKSIWRNSPVQISNLRDRVIHMTTCSSWFTECVLRLLQQQQRRRKVGHWRLLPPNPRPLIRKNLLQVHLRCSQVATGFLPRRKAMVMIMPACRPATWIVKQSSQRVRGGCQSAHFLTRSPLLLPCLSIWCRHTLQFPLKCRLQESHAQRL